MQERLGYRKIVYRDGSYTKVVEGECYSEDPFIRVETSNGDVYVNKTSIVVIKQNTRGDIDD